MAGAGKSQRHKSKLILDAYMPYRLSIAANKVSAVIAKSYRQTYGLKVQEWRILAVLNEQSPLTAQNLCEVTAMDKVNVSRAIQSLHRQGFIIRNKKPEDGRSFNVELSQTGKEVFNAIEPLALGYERSILTSFDFDERADLFRLLSKLESALKSQQA